MSDQNTASQKKPSAFAKFKKFANENSGTVVKTIIYQIGLTVFGFLLYSASVDGSTGVMAGLGAFSAVFYLVLLYVMSWDNGAKDKIRIESGRIKRDCFKGAKTALLANIPNLLLAVLSLVGYLFIDKAALNSAGAYISPKWAVNLHGIAQIIGIFLNSMYTGLADAVNLETKPFYLFLVCIPCIIACGLGYFLGTMEKFGIFTSAPKDAQK